MNKQRNGDASRQKDEHLKQHPKESTIEAYLRAKHLMDAALQQSVAEHLNNCEACRTIADFLGDFYDQFEKMEIRSLEWDDKFTNRLFSDAHVLPLYPYRAELKPDVASDGYAVVLAAMSPKPAPHRFETVAVLASARQDMLVRLLRDHDNNLFRLYVITEDQRRCAHALISFPELRVEVKTDEKGQAIFALAETAVPVNWEQTPCMLKLPLAKVRVAVEALQRPSSAEPMIITVDDYLIAVTNTQNKLAFAIRTCRPMQVASSLAALEGTAGSLLLIPLQNGRGVCELPDTEQDLILRFYC